MLLLRTQRCGLYPAVSRVNRACSITRGELTKEFLRDLRHVMKSDVTSPRKDAKKSQEFLKNVVQLDDDDGGETDRNQYCGQDEKKRERGHLTKEF